jgi:hypothetical protein
VVLRRRLLVLRGLIVIITSPQSPFIAIDSGDEKVWYDAPAKRSKGVDALRKANYPPAAMAGEKEGMQFKLKHEKQVEYCTEVSMMLNDIASTRSGNALFTKINAKRNTTKVTITMPELSKALMHMESGSSPNQTIAGAGNFYLGLPGEANTSDLAAKAALKTAFDQAKSAVGASTIATKIGSELRGRLTVRSRFDDKPWKFVDGDIEGWYAGGFGELRGWQQRWLGYMVASWLASGPGSDCLLKFDPWNHLQGTNQRQPIIGLYHELCHACYYMCGQTVFDDFTHDTELLAIGMNPFDQMPVTGDARLNENDFRAERQQRARDYI